MAQVAHTLTQQKHRLATRLVRVTTKIIHIMYSITTKYR